MIAACSRGRVGVLDDLGDLAVRVAHDAPVAVGIGRDEAQHGDGRLARVAAMLVQQGIERMAVEQWHVGVGDQDVAGVIVGQRLERTLHRVSGAELLFLHRDVDLAAQLVGQRGHRGADPVAVVADDGDQVIGVDGVPGMQGVPEQRTAGQFVQYLRGLRAHPGPGARGEHHNGGAVRHEISQSRLQTLSLRRQDSNLNYLNQNQRCCHYTTADRACVPILACRCRARRTARPVACLDRVDAGHTIVVVGEGASDVVGAECG